MPDYPNLAGLLIRLNEIEGLERIRFLTSHPNYMTDDLLRRGGEPAQGHAAHRGAHPGRRTTRCWRTCTAATPPRITASLVERIRERIPGVSIATDIIVGFPGETEEQFMDTYRLLDELQLDVAHLARYSTRPGTVAATRGMGDDVPEAEKMRRFRLLEDLQEQVIGEINARYLGQRDPGAVRGKGQEALEGPHPHQQAGLCGEPGRPARAGAARRDHLDRPLVDDWQTLAPL